MNFLRFMFRFGWLSGLARFGFAAIGIVAAVLAIYPMNIVLSAIAFAGVGLLVGTDIAGYGFYIHGQEYFTVQPESSVKREKQQ